MLGRTIFLPHPGIYDSRISPDLVFDPCHKSVQRSNPPRPWDRRSAQEPEIDICLEILVHVVQLQLPLFLYEIEFVESARPNVSDDDRAEVVQLGQCDVPSPTELFSCPAVLQSSAAVKWPVWWIFAGAWDRSPRVGLLHGRACWAVE